MSLRFKIGDTIWHGRFDSQTAFIPCPDCGGSGRLRVTFDDETTASIECATCGPGYEPPTGRVKIYERKPVAQIAIVSGFRVDGGTVEWQTSNCYSVEDANAFDNEADALASAERLATDHNKAEIERLSKKHKDTKSWAWNASYHRCEIKEARRRIEYHTAKLNIAKLKAKEDAE